MSRFGLVALIAGASLQAAFADREFEGKRQHVRIILPADPATLNSNCTAEAAAYAAAVVNLETAQQVADEAYDALLECEGMNIRPVEPTDPGPSVLTSK